jgi:hypothetical protein
MEPLEPLSPGAPLPRMLKLSLSVIAQAWVLSTRVLTSRTLVRQEFTWRVPLPAQPSAITRADWEVPLAKRGTFYKEKVPLEVRIAAERSRAYECQSDPAGSIRWLRNAISLLPPDSNYAQFLRGGLSDEYRHVPDPVNEKRVLREILEVKRRYPQTWEHYAKMARWSLAHPRRAGHRVRGQ